MSSLYLWLGGGKTQWLLWRGGELSPENINCHWFVIVLRITLLSSTSSFIIYDDDDDDEVNVAQCRKYFHQEHHEVFQHRHDHMLVGENVLGNYARSKG